MTTWNYRLVRHVTGDGVTYAIHEAYYNEEGLVWLISQDAIEPTGETIEELRQDWALIAEAFTRPMLDYKTRLEYEPTPLTTAGEEWRG